MIYILLGINIILLVLGQTLWKIGLSGMELKLTFQGIIKMFLNPYVFGGLAVYGVATVIWMYILSKAEISLVYPLQSLCYVITAVVAVLIFKESVPATRWFGIGLIILGAYFVSIK